VQAVVFAYEQGHIRPGYTWPTPGRVVAACPWRPHRHPLGAAVGRFANYRRRFAPLPFWSSPAGGLLGRPARYDLPPLSYAWSGGVVVGPGGVGGPL